MGPSPEGRRDRLFDAVASVRGRRQVSGRSRHRVRFRCDTDQANYESMGYTVRRVLSGDAADELLRATESRWRRQATGFGSTTTLLTRAQNREVSEEIWAAMATGVAAILDDHRPVGATLLVKAPGGAGEVAVHQDWTMVDERRTSSLNIWCALTPVGPDDGGLQVLTGSHRWWFTARSPTLASVQVPVDRVRPALERLQLQPGEAVFYDHRLFHGSAPVASGRTRVVAQVGIVADHAPLTTCIRSGDDVFAVAVDDAALLDAASTGELRVTGRPRRRLRRLDAVTPEAVVQRAFTETRARTSRPADSNP